MPELSIVDSQPLPDASPQLSNSRGAATVAPSVQATLDLISHYEAGGRNVPNYRFDPGHTAQGYYQITNTNWNRLAPRVGIDTATYPNAMSAPKDVQAKVAGYLLTETPAGIRNWSDFNPQLRAALSAAPARVASTGTASRSAGADTSAPPAPAQPLSIADNAGPTGGDDIMSRIMRGEQVQVTPSDILRIAFGPTGAEQAPTLSVAKSEPLSILNSEPLPPAAPPPPQQPPALERAWNAFTGSSGLQTLGGLSSAFPALAGRISGMPDYANEQRFKNTVSGLYQGIVGEPARISSELQKSGEALLKGDVNAAADHIWFAIPYLGAVGAQMKEYLDRGDVAGALGHAAGALGSAAIATPEGRAAVAEAPAAVADAAAKVPEAISNIPGAVADAVPAAASFVKAAAPDVAKGAGKMAAGTVIAKTPIPEVLKFGTGLPLASSGAKQIIAGIKKGWAAAKEAGAAEAEAAPEAAAAATPVPEAPTPLPPSRQLPAPAIVTPPPADASAVTAVPATYPEVEPGFTRPPATPGTTSTPWPGTPAASGLSFDELARSLTGKSPTKLTVAERASVQGIYDRITQGIPPEPPPSPRVMPQAAAAQVFPEAYPQPKPAPPATPPVPASATPSVASQPPAVAPEPPAPPASASSAAQALYDELRRSGTLEPEPAPAEKPAFEQRARDAKVDKLYELITSKRVPQEWVARFTPESWRILAHEVGVPEPSAATIRQLKARLADYYNRPKAIPINGSTTPAEAQAAFQRARR